MLERLAAIVRSSGWAACLDPTRTSVRLCHVEGVMRRFCSGVVLAALMAASMAGVRTKHPAVQESGSWRRRQPRR